VLHRPIETALFLPRADPSGECDVVVHLLLLAQLDHEPVGERREHRPHPVVVEQRGAQVHEERGTAGWGAAGDGSLQAGHLEVGTASVALCRCEPQSGTLPVRRRRSGERLVAHHLVVPDPHDRLEDRGHRSRFQQCAHEVGVVCIRPARLVLESGIHA
jgi:hypothetical protein